MITRRPYSRTATRREDRIKIRDNHGRQPGWLNGKLRTSRTGRPSVAQLAVGRLSVQLNRLGAAAVPGQTVAVCRRAAARAAGRESMGQWPVGRSK
jgi:hypothetical protein